MIGGQEHFFLENGKTKTFPFIITSVLTRTSLICNCFYRYDIMTSNNAESFNNKTRNARTFPITTLLEFIRFTLQTWFFNREEIARKCDTRLSPKFQDNLEHLNGKAQYVNTYGLGMFECNVRDERGDFDVHLMNNTCTCGLPQLLGIPCEHAIASAQHRSVDIYSLCSPFYSKEIWIEMYKESIYPVGNEDQWNVPDDIKNMKVLAPVEKKQAGRPKKSKQGRRRVNRYPSQGEKVVIHRKCGKCGGMGHNRKTCTWRE